MSTLSFAQLGGAGGIGSEFFLDLLPNIVAWFMRGLKQLPGLIGDILQIANQRGAVLASLQVTQQSRIVVKTFRTCRKQLWEVLLKLGTGQ
jgi:hypothetical protein